jgi:hypothetical protein
LLKIRFRATIFEDRRLDSKLKQMAPKYSRQMSPHAAIGKAVWLNGIKPAVILDMEGDHCLVRIGDEQGGWSDLVWVEGYDGPIVGTPPSDDAVSWRRQMLALPLSARPPLPRKTLRNVGRTPRR